MYPTPRGLDEPTARTMYRAPRSSISRIAFLPALVVGLLSACAYHPPVPLVPAETLAALRERSTDPIPPRAHESLPGAWFPLAEEVEFADGLDLAELSTLALFYSPRLRIARTSSAIAGAEVLQSGLLDNPELFAGPRITANGSEWIVPVGGSWKLPLWGERGADREAAMARQQQRNWELAQLEIDLLRDVRRAWLELTRLRRQHAFHQQLVESSRRLLAWSDGLRAAGELDRVSVFLAVSEQDEARAELARSEAELRSVERRLRELAGLLPDAELTFVLDSESALPELPAPEQRALLALPRLRRAEAGYQEAEARLRQELARQYPSLRLGPEYEYDSGESSVGIGLGLTLPIFDRNQGAIRAALEARTQARQLYEGELLSAMHEEARARDALAAAERQLALHQEGALESVDAAARALEARLQSGRADVTLVLAAQRALARARIRRIELAQRVATARLEAAVAGGLAFEKVRLAPRKETGR